MFLLQWPVSGGITSSSLQLPPGETLVCEHPWTIRLLTYHPSSVVPRRMYFSSSSADSASPKLFISLSVKSPGSDSTHALIIKTAFNPATGNLEPTGDFHSFPDFKEGHGIASSANGSVVAWLARRRNGTTTPGSFDKDILLTHPDSAWMTQPGSVGKGLQDQMWLLEWLAGDIKAMPKKYIVHKAIGSWETGNNYLFYGENDNTYGFGLKAMVFGPGPDSGRHEADAFLVVNRANYTMMPSRGWSWAIGTGHTEFNRPAYNPVSKKYAVLGSTDYNDPGICGLGDISIRRDDYGQDSVFSRYPSYGTLQHKGGPGTLLAMPDSGFIGLIIGEKGIANPMSPAPSCNALWPNSPPTSIGLVRFNSKMKLQGGIRWIAAMDSTFLSYPQLARLDSNRFLLGYGKMYDMPSKNDWNGDKWRIPQAYYLVEIDTAGKLLTPVQSLDSLGWGEQDQMVSLGKGRVAWAYIPNPAIKSSTLRPACTSTTLKLMVYTSQGLGNPVVNPNRVHPLSHRMKMTLDRDKLSITTNLPDQVRFIATRIYNAQGKMLLTATWTSLKPPSHQFFLPISKPLPQGLYFVESSFSDGQSERGNLFAP